jgi:Xaa-Pro aminopeptidase
MATGAGSPAIYIDRLRRAQQVMNALDVDALLLSVGSDLPYLCGYTAMPLERLTMLVVARHGTATLFIPALEAPRVTPMDAVFSLHPWTETQNPISLVARQLGTLGARRVAVGDTMWARFLVDLIAEAPELAAPHSLVRSSLVMNPLRTVKDGAEVAQLAAASAAVDRIAAQLQAGQIPLIGRSEADVGADLSARILSEGHELVNFAIVATGANAASPHHHPGDRVIERNELVLCDFGGTMAGYCSDITRCVFTGPHVPAEIADAYEVLFAAQAAGVAAGVVGAGCQDVDRAARRVIDEGGYGDYFIHRTGHGIGMEAHEDPYMVEGNDQPIAAGHAFSVEPGIYLPERWGMRLEDIVVATADGPRALNSVDHRLIALG